MSKPCTFCKAENTVKKTPLMELKRNGKYEPIETFCCKAQEANNKYVQTRFKPEDAPDISEVEKW